MVYIPTQEHGNEKSFKIIYGFGILNFGYCNLFDICDLIFVICYLTTRLKLQEFPRRRGRNSDPLSACGHAQAGIKGEGAFWTFYEFINLLVSF